MAERYLMVYQPGHHRAKVNGMVYVHILEAEKMLGRPLQEKEIVHHEDENKHNNSQDNLYVFATSADHTRYHHSGVKVKVDDYWVSPVEDRYCTACGNKLIFGRGKSSKMIYCSTKCRQEAAQTVDRPSKEELLSLIKNSSFSAVGKKYGVSDNAIRKWCKAYGLPHRKQDII